jgi:hypothetical protein
LMVGIPAEAGSVVAAAAADVTVSSQGDSQPLSQTY